MNYNITSKHNITRWDEAIPLGNGEMGCLIWGSPACLRFSLDRVDIWDTTTPAGTESPEFNYRTLVYLATLKDTERIREIFDAPYYAPVPTKLPVGKIILHIPQYADVTSTLSLAKAEANLRLSGTEETADSLRLGAASGLNQSSGPANIPGTFGPRRPRTAQIKSFLHAVYGIGVISVDLPPDAFSIELQAPEFGRANKNLAHTYCKEERSISQGSLQQIQYPEPLRTRISLSDFRSSLNLKDFSHGSAAERDGYLEYFRQDTNDSFSYGVVMGVYARDGHTEIYYRVVTSKEKESAFQEQAYASGNSSFARGTDAVFEAAMYQISNFMNQGYERLFLSHTEWWKDYWNQSRIQLPDTFMEKNWYISNYLLASCSRKGFYPMPLQGVWTADEDALPPWKGDYHNDLNTQMSYYHYLKANHISQGEAFVDFLWNRREAGRTFAKNFYETDGLCLPAVMTIDGKALGGWPMYSLSPTNQIWLCKAFDDFYRYTKDAAFFSKRAYPYFQETEACIGALLEEREDGLLYLPISSSPEIHDDEAEAFLTPNSNYDLSLLHYLYETLEDYANRLGEEKHAAQYSQKRQKLPSLAFDSRGVLLLAPDEALQESHRHFSHAHGIHPLRLLKYDSPQNRRRIDAVLKDLEQLGTQMWVGFSFCWMAELYAIAHKGNQAAKMLEIFWSSFCSSNGFHLNGDYKKRGYSSFDYRPFTLEANMCAADALQEMLLYTEEGLFEPFPAIPDAWKQKEVSFENFRGQGGIRISCTLNQGTLTRLLIQADTACSVKLQGWSRLGEAQEGALQSIALQKGKNHIIG